MRILPLLLSMMIACSAMGQQQRPSFEVASVKRGAGNGFPDAKPRRSGERVTMHNIRLATAIIYAYQLAGNLQMPNVWEEYDIDAAANLAAAVEEELGLKLKRNKGPVQVLVVDRLQKPTEN